MQVIGHVGTSKDGADFKNKSCDTHVRQLEQGISTQFKRRGQKLGPISFDPIVQTWPKLHFSEPSSQIDYFLDIEINANIGFKSSGITSLTEGTDCHREEALDQTSSSMRASITEEEIKIVEIQRHQSSQSTPISAKTSTPLIRHELLNNLLAEVLSTCDRINLTEEDNGQLVNTSGELPLIVMEDPKSDCAEVLNQLLHTEYGNCGEIWEVEEAEPIVVQHQGDHQDK